MAWFADNNELKKQTRTMDHILFLFKQVADAEWVSMGFAELRQLKPEYQKIVLDKTETLLAEKQQELVKKLPELKSYQQQFADAAERKGKKYDWDLDLDLSLEYPLNEWRRAFKYNTWIAQGIAERRGEGVLSATKLFAEHAGLYSIYEEVPGIGEEVDAMIAVGTRVSRQQAEAERKNAIGQLKDILAPSR